MAVAFEPPTGKKSGAGGNRTPVRQGVTGCDTTIPGLKRYGYFRAESPDTEVSATGLSLGSAFFLAVSGLSQLSFPASVARLQRTGPAIPLGDAMCVVHLSRN